MGTKDSPPYRLLKTQPTRKHKKAYTLKTAKELLHLKQPGMHAVGGGATGLYLCINNANGKSWVFRYQISVGQFKKRREMGLGSYQDISLAEARENARELRKILLAGKDPLTEKSKTQLIKKQQVLVESNAASIHTFEKCAYTYINNKAAEWSHPKQKKQWISSLETYAFPVIGKLDVKDITVHHLKTLLDEIWLTKHTTATRVRSRIENILAFASISGYRDDSNPASLKSLNAFLPKSSKVHKPTHFAALPYSDIPQLMRELKEKEGVGFRALEIVILTAKRSGEVRQAAKSEFDLTDRIWTIPADRMKNNKVHREPLTTNCIKYLQQLNHHKNNDWLFPGPVKKIPISDMTMSKALKSLRDDCTVHGFRSSFRQWAAEQTNYPREICELALSHSVLGKVEAAYQRSDLFEKRQQLMNEWSAFCCSATSS